MKLVRAAAVVAALVVAAAAPAHAGDPTRVYRTVETEHFVIYYWAPMDDVAHRVGVVAERAHRTLAPALDHLPDAKTLIFIADDTDSANGFAGVLPRNAIQLYATGPTGFSELDDHEDWLYGLVAHEYTHILHIDTMSGLPVIYNHIFGRTWAPNQIMPRWLIEGIAVYEESKRSAGGRNRGTRFDQFIRIARHANVDLRLDEISGAPRQFPGGNAAYVYGSHFLRYVFDRFGDDTLRAMAHTAGGYAPPFALNRQIAKVTGRPFTELYDDWKLYLRDRYAMEETAAERRGLRLGRAITHTAQSNTFQRWSTDGKELLWSQYDGDSLARVRAVAAGGDQAQARDVVQLEQMGPFDVASDGSLVFEQGWQFRRDYSFEDILRWDAATKQIVRLTTGRRARDPALSPDGRKVAFSQNEHSESVLAVIDAVPDAPSTIVWRGERYDQAYQPAWSPDGARIAFSAWRNGGLRDILVVEVASGKVTEITHDRAVDMAPAWSADGRTLYFDSDRTGISNVYAYDLADGSTWQVTNVLGGAFGGRPSPDGTRLAYSGAVPAGGYDLYELPLDRATWQPARPMLDDKPPPVVVRDDEAVVSAPRAYRSLETLAPQSWTAGLDLSGASPTATIQTGGTDAVGLHSYALGVGVALDQGTTDVGVSYGYGGFRPGLRVAGSRSLISRGLKIDGVSMPFPEEDWSGSVSVGIPFEARPGASWAMSLDYGLNYFRKVGGPSLAPDPNQRVPVLPVTDYLEAGVGVRMSYSNVRSLIFGLGPYTGFDASTSLRVDHPAFGSANRAITVSYTFDTYQNLWSPRTMLALRVTGAMRAGDLVHGGGFGLGGVPPQDVAQSIVDSSRASSIGYLRGYPIREIVGNQFQLANFELRREAFRIEHGLATLPIYLRRVHIAALADVGTAYDTRFQMSQLRKSVGGAVRLDAFFGYFVPGTFELGAARGLDKDGITEMWFLLTGTL